MMRCSEEKKETQPRWHSSQRLWGSCPISKDTALVSSKVFKIIDWLLGKSKSYTVGCRIRHHNHMRPVKFLPGSCGLRWDIDDAWYQTLWRWWRSLATTLPCPALWLLVIHLFISGPHLQTVQSVSQSHPPTPYQQHNSQNPIHTLDKSKSHPGTVYIGHHGHERKPRYSEKAWKLVRTNGR